MMQRTTLGRCFGAFGAAALIVLSAALATAQQPAAQQPAGRTAGAAEGGGFQLAIPTGVRETSLVLLEANVPSETKTNTPYNFTLRVTNISQHLALDDLVVFQDTPPGYEVQQSNPPHETSLHRPGGANGQQHDRQRGEPTPAGAQPGQQPGEQQPRDQQPPRDLPPRDQQQPRDQQPRDLDQQPRDQQPRDPDQQPRDQQPRDEQAGAQQPARQGAQQPRQQTGGQQAGGQQAGGRARQPIQRVSWNLPALAPGQSAEIQVTAIGEREGRIVTCFGVEYQPRLCVATVFTEPEISLVKAQPERAHLCQPIVWQYRVTNTGTGVARGVQVRDQLPEGIVTREGQREVRFDAGDIQPNQSQEFEAQLMAARPGTFGSRAEARSAGDLSAQSNQPQTQVLAPQLELEARGPSSAVINEPFTYNVVVRNTGEVEAINAVLDVQLDERLRVQRASEQARGEGAAQRVALGNLAPGQEREVWFRVIGTGEKRVENVFRVISECAGDMLEERDQVVTEIFAIPAAHMVVIDSVDPVPLNEEVTYTIQVVNEGSSPLSNARVSANLPEQLRFVRAGGHTEGRGEGQMVTFQPVEQIEPGADLRWTVVCRAQAAGQIRFQAKLEADELDQPVITEEPTTLFDPAAPAPATARPPGEQQER